MAKHRAGADGPTMVLPRIRRRTNYQRWLTLLAGPALVAGLVIVGLLNMSAPPEVQAAHAAPKPTTVAPTPKPSSAPPVTVEQKAADSAENRPAPSHAPAAPKPPQAISTPPEKPVAAPMAAPRTITPPPAVQAVSGAPSEQKEGKEEIDPEPSSKHEPGEVQDEQSDDLEMPERPDEPDPPTSPPSNDVPCSPGEVRDDDGKCVGGLLDNNDEGNEN